MRHTIWGLAPNDWQKNNGRDEGFHEFDEYNVGNVEFDIEIEMSKGQLAKCVWKWSSTKGKAWIELYEDTLNMEVSHKEYFRGNYGAFSRASGLLKFIWWWSWRPWWSDNKETERRQRRGGGEGEDGERSHDWSLNGDWIWEHGTREPKGTWGHEGLSREIFRSSQGRGLDRAQRWFCSRNCPGDLIDRFVHIVTLSSSAEWVGTGRRVFWEQQSRNNLQCTWLLKLGWNSS